MEKCPALDQLRDTIHALLHEDDLNNQEKQHHYDASAMCDAVEVCLSQGLKRVSSTETVSLWGLLQWTNVTQLERYQAWKIQYEKKQAKEQSKDWYLDMFKEELEQISTLKVRQDNQTENLDETTNPMTPGFNASIRIVNTLLHVKTPQGRVRAWIRHCCNTHILSTCLAAIMHPMNQAALNTYFTPGALCCDADMREIFVGLTSTLDRLQFGFQVDNPILDKISSQLNTTTPQVEREEMKLATAVADSSNNVLLHVLDNKTQWLHQLLKITPPSILSPVAENVVGEARPVFGVPLVQLLISSSTCDMAQFDCKIGIPNLVEGCCRLIDAAAASCTPALFSSKIQKSRFIELVDQVERVGTLSIWSNVHHSIVILIKWLRDLPEPIFPQHLFSHVLAVLDMPGEALPVMELRNLVNQLHWSVKPTLARICSTLERAVRGENVNMIRTFIELIVAGDDSTLDVICSTFARILFPRNSQFIEAQARIVKLLIENSSAVLADIKTMTEERTRAASSKIRKIQTISEELHAHFDPQQYPTLWETFRHHYPAVETPDVLRGGGLLVVRSLVYFAEEHQELASQLIAQRVLGHAKQYPLPVASVHIARMLVELLQLDVSVAAKNPPIIDIDTNAWFNRCDGKENDDGRGPLVVSASLSLFRMDLWSLFDEDDAFHRLYGWSILLFDRNYSRSGASCMDFNTILAETRVQILAHLQKKPRSIPHLYQIWAESLGTLERTPKASAHMRTYTVVWEGGVTIRAYPSRQAESIGVREEGDHIDTVLQAGNWLKLRDLPGGQGGGWILAKTEEATLVKLVDPTRAV